MTACKQEFFGSCSLTTTHAIQEHELQVPILYEKLVPE
jgi:hypothetical protein